VKGVYEIRWAYVLKVVFEFVAGLALTKEGFFPWNSNL
jgi:hypothetical protein